MESNLDLTIKKPKLNVESVSSAVFGRKDGDTSLKDSINNIHETLSKLTAHVRKSLIRIKGLESAFENIEEKLVINTEKTSEVEKKIVLNTEKTNEVEKKIVNIEKVVGTTDKPKLEGSGLRDNYNDSLIETNKILVDIQNQLLLQSQQEKTQEKEEKRRESIAESKKKLKKEESALAKTAKGIGKAVGKVTSKILSPIKNIFDKVLDFLLTLVAGIAVNAVFEWLKDEENINKVKGWFSWIKENWQWIAAAVGAIALLPIIGAISGLLSPVGIIVGLLAKAVPLLISVLTNPVFLGVAAGAGLLLGMKAAVDAGKRYGAGGQAHLDAREALRDELNEAGITIKGFGKKEKFYLTGTGRGAGDRGQKSASGGTEEQKALIENYKKRRDALIDNADAMKAEISKERDAVEPVMIERETSQRERQRGASPTKTVEDRQATEKLRNEAESKVRVQFEGNIPSIIEARRMGGPVTAGRPYLVGESGPELFAPNINGSVINNMKTEKIYQMISSDTGGEGSINMIELPPITNEMAPPEVPVPKGEATEVPNFPSANMADPYRILSPRIYGITV